MGSGLANKIQCGQMSLAYTSSFPQMETSVAPSNIMNSSVSARPEFLGVIDDPLFENLGVIGKFRGSELF